MVLSTRGHTEKLKPDSWRSMSGARVLINGFISTECYLYRYEIF